MTFVEALAHWIQLARIRSMADTTCAASELLMYTCSGGSVCTVVYVLYVVYV